MTRSSAHDRLRRAIQRLVEDQLAEEMLNGRIKDGDTVLVDAEDDEIVLRAEGEQRRAYHLALWPTEVSMKGRTHFVCQSCGAMQARWMGRCPECGEWNTLVETVIEEPGRSGSARGSGAAIPESQAQPLSEIVMRGQRAAARADGGAEPRAGGRHRPGSVVLIGGDPGIGKSTLLLQLAALMSAEEAPVLYVSGEESPQQIKLRAERLGIDSPQPARPRRDQPGAHPAPDRSCQAPPGDRGFDPVDLHRRADLLGGEHQPGARVRHCPVAPGQGAELSHLSRRPRHQDGSIAGPRVLEHIVDTVLYLEGERFHAFRLLRSVKNRFGSTNEVGVFEMRDQGLVEVSNPSQLFLEERLGHATGSAVAVTMEGTRPLLVEMQALVSKASGEIPRRTCNGVDINRVLLLAAVLSKRVGLRLGDQDIFVNVVGGLRVREPAVDLAMAVAIASSYYNRPVLADLAIFGEIGLAGELRSVGQASGACARPPSWAFSAG